MNTKHVKQFNNFHQTKHPLILDKLSRLRDQKIGHKACRELIHALSLLLVYEATAHLSMTTIQIQTPLEYCDTEVLASSDVVILPILRAGLGMVDALLTLMPQALVGYLGLCRDKKTLEPTQYYLKIPENKESAHYFVCDVMLATGGSAVHAVNVLKAKQIKNITLICIIVAPEGREKFCHAHPDVPVYVAGVDRELDRNGHIRPGLGDAGDRLSGTL